MPAPRSRSGPPAHANKVKYEPNRGDKHNTLNKLVAALPNGGMCKKCTEVIEWKKSYGKYKPLKQPAKCCGCGKRAVDLPYCQLCEAFYWLMPRLSRFHERHPAIEVRVVSAMAPLTQAPEPFDVATLAPLLDADGASLATLTAESESGLGDPDAVQARCESVV